MKTDMSWLSRYHSGHSNDFIFGGCSWASALKPSQMLLNVLPDHSPAFSRPYKCLLVEERLLFILETHVPCVTARETMSG